MDLKYNFLFYFYLRKYLIIILNPKKPQKFNFITFLFKVAINSKIHLKVFKMKLCKVRLYFTESFL